MEGGGHPGLFPSDPSALPLSTLAFPITLYTVTLPQQVWTPSGKRRPPPRRWVPTGKEAPSL